MVNNNSSIINDVQHLESLYPAKSREKEIEKILSFVREGKSCQLIALPGVGRANILGFLAYNRSIRIHHVGEKQQTQYHFVLCNFSEVKNRPLFDVMKFIFLELGSSLHARRREEEFLIVDKFFKDALSYQDELVLFQALKDAINFLILEKKLSVTFLFERFETYIPQISADFFNNLVSLKTRAEDNLSFVFSTTRPLEDTLELDILADFYAFIADNHVYLPLLDTEGLQFRISYLEKITGKKIPQAIIKTLITITGGHTQLVRLSLEAMLAKSKEWIPDSHKGTTFPEGSQARDDNLEAFLLELKSIQNSLKSIWQFLTPDEQHHIEALSQGQKGTPNAFLENIGLITRNTITIPLFQAYVQRYAPMQHAEKFTYEATTQAIKRGDTIISDTLTRSEFRLLTALLEKENTIIDREEIIHTVWSDSKTQEGVSEQAVDQLIFRLRKKIEEDPNNPRHIQTVKGRGIRFVQ